MPNPISEILNNTSYGLLPYLNTSLGNRYDRLQIRPYSFSTNTLNQTTSGYRLREARTRIESQTLLITQSIVLGKMIQLTSDYSASQIAAAELQADIDAAVFEWSQCRCPHLTSPVEEFGGAIAPTQDSGTRQWWLVVVRDFQIQYRA